VPDRQKQKSTYAYLLASRNRGEALIIDPVLEKIDRNLQLVRAGSQAGQGGGHASARRPHYRPRRYATERIASP
jgi:hypothetical protein